MLISNSSVQVTEIIKILFFNIIYKGKLNIPLFFSVFEKVLIFYNLLKLNINDSNTNN